MTGVGTIGRRLAPELAVFATMLGGMVVVSAMRPLFALRHASDSEMHAFASASMLGAVVMAPFLSARAERRGPVLAAAVFAGLESLATLACTTNVPGYALVALRFVQGGLNVATLSLAMSIVGAAHSAAQAMPRRAAAMMLGLLLGSPVGALSLGLGARGPFYVAALALVVAALAMLALRREPLASAVAEPSPALPVAADEALHVARVLGFAERFTVGAFVVTFANHAHGTLGMSDRAISLAYSALLFPFALSVYPLMRFGARIRRSTSIAFGCTTYAAAFGLLGFARGPSVFLALFVAGVASAFVYAPALCFASGGRANRARALASFHAAGCLGMALGPAAAGTLGATLRHAGVVDSARYTALFCLAAAAQLAAFALTRSRTMRLVSTSPVPLTRGEPS